MGSYCSRIFKDMITLFSFLVDLLVCKTLKFYMPFFVCQNFLCCSLSTGLCRMYFIRQTDKHTYTHTRTKISLCLCTTKHCVFKSIVYLPIINTFVYAEKRQLKIIKVDKLKLKTSNLQKLILLFRGLVGGMAVLCTAQPSQ